MTSPFVSRRALLGGAAGAAALTALPISVRQALAAPARPGRLEDIQHVVVLMQENRAFDHYFGTMAGVRGYGDRTAVRGVNGRPVWDQPDPSRAEGYLAPFAMDAAHTSAYQQGAAAFGYGDSMNARNDGIGDGYVTRRDSGRLGQGYYAPADMPFYNALASVFTICDNYHASIETSTNPNREHFMTGTSGGSLREFPVIDNTEVSAGYEWTTYAERLQAAGISWKTYQAQENFDDNALAWFSAFHQAKPGQPLYDRGLARAGDAANAGNPWAMGDALVAAFGADVAADALPQVSWLVAPAALSEHASYAPPDGENLTARLLAALAAKPEVWAKTALFLTYDEHGGFFDHLLPPVPPLAAGRGDSTVSTDGEVVVRVAKGGSTFYRVVDQRGRYRVAAADGTLSWSPNLPAGETVTAGPFPLGLGLRVPMIVASPWTRGGAVDSTVFDHTSVIKFLERRFGVHEPNISAWRRAVTGDLTSAFDFSGDEPQWPSLPDTSGNRQKVTDTGKLPAPTVPSPQVRPVQARGTRTARPVPYTLSTRGRLRGGALELDYANSGTQAAVFAAYPAPGVKPRFFTVGARKRLSDSWKVGADGYDLRVHGPNGSLWHFRGGQGDTSEAVFAEDVHRRELRVELRNGGRRARTFTVGDLAYGGGTHEVRIDGGRTRTVTLPVAREGWYDVAVGAGDDLFWLRRAAGRLADGRQGVTDPAMGLPDALVAEVALASGSTTVDEPVVVPGTPATVSAVLTAPDAAVDRIEAALVVPAGWTVRTLAAPPRRLARGASATVRWQVTAPAALPSGTTARVLANVRGRAGSRVALADGEVAARTAPSMKGYLLGEDFESLAGQLKPAVNLNVPAGVLGWTATPPAGWSVTNAPGMPQGTAEEQGWSFMTKRFWLASDSQDRGNFTRGLGIVAVADPDDWDDTGSPSSKGRFDSTLSSPAVAIPSGTAELYLGFDSHYRQEAPQTATVTAAFDTGEETVLLTYSGAATGNDNAGGDAENQLITRKIAVPAGAAAVTLKFRMFDAGNNWYWAIDHVRIGLTPVAD
ncbi:phosphocholine-specific phospholipase C [Streptomyces sp. NPDC087270]|uniref:phosphocholine-specific phospholipase C n=1 Tax=Streptomyces sp. NPDC087270 TaxID=3365774 RepID=UPI0038153480